ncbi:hypothetical protein ACFQX6_41600 [Streptosporangium lutulentum]
MEPEHDGLIFVGEKGARLRRGNFTKVRARALKAAELPRWDLAREWNTVVKTTRPKSGLTP